MRNVHWMRSIYTRLRGDNMKGKRWKSIFLMVFAAVFFAYMFGATADARTLVGKGRYKGFEYWIDEESGNVVISDYKGKSKTVITPKTIKGKKVTEIEDSTFYRNTRIEKLVISEGIEKIGDMALFDMQSLKQVSLPMSLRSLSKDCGLNYYSEASDFPAITYTVVKGSPAFQYVTKNCSSSKIIVKKTNKVVLWFYGNSAPKAKSVTKGKKYSKLPTMKKRGYRFAGWYTKKNGGKKITAKTKAKKNQIAYAHWEYLGKKAMLQNPRYNKLDESYTWDTIQFGKYQYDGEEDPIKWLVLSVNGDEALLMAADGLDAQPYCMRSLKQDENGKNIYVYPKECTWATSTLRSWLNGYPATENVAGMGYSLDGMSSFYDTAFSSEEKSMILDSTVTNSGVTGGNTVDKVFIFSNSEFMTPEYMLKWLDLDPTDHAKARAKSVGATTDPENVLWLRDMATAGSAYVLSGGEEHTNKAIPTCGYNGVAESENLYSAGMDTLPYVYPVIRVNLSNEALWEIGKCVSID